MLTLSVGELKANFSDVLKRVGAGEEIAISYGKRKGIIARIVPENKKKQKRKLGVLDGKAKVGFKRNFKITDEEFLGL